MGRRLFMFEVADPVFATHEGRAVFLDQALAHIRRDVADGDPDPAFAHASEPNRAAESRIGIAIRYVTPNVRCMTCPRDSKLSASKVSS